MDKRCKCGEVEMPNGWGGIETKDGNTVTVHYFDYCGKMIIYDEAIDTAPINLGVQKNCSACDGRGWVPTRLPMSSTSCYHCNGTGRLSALSAEGKPK